MPPPYVVTIRDQILYEHAMLMSRSAFGKLVHGYIYDRFKLLRDGRLKIDDTILEWEREEDLPHECVFCGSGENLTTDHLIPMRKGGSDSADNLVQTCQSCNRQRGEKGIFEWLGMIRKDSLHRLVAARYLRQLLQAHQKARTLDISKEEIGALCHSCPLPGVCEEWASEGKLTCFCLESVLPGTS
jgi:hypothetical protein